jgi:hypothetical protein
MRMLIPFCAPFDFVPTQLSILVEAFLPAVFVPILQAVKNR